MRPATARQGPAWQRLQMQSNHIQQIDQPQLEKKVPSSIRSLTTKTETAICYQVFLKFTKYNKKSQDFVQLSILVLYPL